LRDTDLDEEQQEFIDLIQNSGDSLLRLVDDILDFSKIEAGRLEIVRQNFDIRELLGEVIKISQEQLKEKSVDLFINIEEDVPTFVESDPGRIRQIFLNLIGNAIKFTNEGSIEIRLEFIDFNERSGPNDNMGSIECSIIDTGIGISKSDQKRLFQVFTQVDSSTTRQYNGVGLGLAITKRLCEILGGSIKLKSEPSVGSTFHFSILVHSNAELECAPLPTSIKRIIPPIINSDLKTLIVEDNSINAKLLSAQLKKIGHSSEIVYNSTECIEYMKNHDYDIIFMDLNMPEMDGFELTARIREQESSSNKTDVPQSIIIAVSAWAMTGMKERCIEAGMDGYLSKPIIREELSKLVEELSSER